MDKAKLKKCLWIAIIIVAIAAIQIQMYSAGYRAGLYDGMIKGGGLAIDSLFEIVDHIQIDSVTVSMNETLVFDAITKAAMVVAKNQNGTEQ